MSNSENLFHRQNWSAQLGSTRKLFSSAWLSSGNFSSNSSVLASLSGAPRETVISLLQTNKLPLNNYNARCKHFKFIRKYFVFLDWSKTDFKALGENGTLTSEDARMILPMVLQYLCPPFIGNATLFLRNHNYGNTKGNYWILSFGLMASCQK